MTHHTERSGLPSDGKSPSAREARHTAQFRPADGLQQAAPHTTAPGSQHAAGPQWSGTPMPGAEATGRDTTPAPGTAPSDARPADRAESTYTDLSLLPAEGRDALSLRMHQAVTDFVENPRQAVEEADSAFDRIVTDLTEALEERRRELRASWHGRDTEARTEELRLAVQRYRDAGEQLLRT